jgi:tetratricopeptide (TPR) repeat protein
MNEESLFAEALEKTREARTVFLDERCKEAAVRKRVDALLQAHDNPDSFLDVLAPSATLSEVPVLDCPGQVIGRYKLLQQIGEGGMGTVWMAQQTEPVKRLVALKLIKAGMDSKQVLARFEAERQALALMDHVNIARVLDAGTTSAGRPYFVMDLVKGVPITRYCDEHHLTPRERLELFIPVCLAIQHAHQKGIIHRDLKPSNVLVAPYDGVPVPKVIDFGVAKAAGQTLTERTLVTGFGSIVGTLEYMSPEQAEINQLDIDTRSDIYSLGVLLYVLLVGSPPFTSEELEMAGMLEILRVIREKEPSKPSSRLSTAERLPTLAANRGTEPAKLMKLVRGELDWIVMKALEKDRNRRYDSAAAFARDLQRYLADEPVQACPPSVGYRLRKFARRNRTALVMASVVMLAVLLVVGALGWMVRDRTAREQEIAQDRAARQAMIRERVTLALDEAHKGHKEGRWRDALDAARRAEALAATGEIDEETHQRVREVLGDMQMLANLEHVRARSTNNEAGFDLKEEDQGNARAFREYGIDIDALPRDEAARRIQARSICYELTVFLDSWSHVRRRLENQGTQQPGKDWKELLEVARAVDPDPWRDRFRQAVLNGEPRTLVELAATAPIASLSAETVDRLGDALLGKETIKEAAVFLKKGQQIHPQDYWINVNLANCLLQLGTQNLDDALRYYTAAVALRPQAVLSHANLANALRIKGRYDEAVAEYREAIRLKPEHYSEHINLGYTLSIQGKLDEAAAAYREAIRLKPDNQLAHNHLGVVLGKQGKKDEAIAAYTEALRISPKFALAQDNLLDVACDLVLSADPKARDPKRAAALVKQLLPLNLNLEMLARCAPLLLLADDTEAYRQLCGRVLGSLGNTRDPRIAYLAARICALAPDAVSDRARVVRLAERAVQFLPIPHHEHSLGLAHYRNGQFDRAIEHLNRSIAGNWKANAANWLVLSMVHHRLGHVDEARKWLDKAAQWIDAPNPKQPQGSLQSLHRHDALACLVLRREAEMLLGVQIRPAD